MVENNERHFVYYCRLGGRFSGPLNHTKGFLRAILSYCNIKSLTVFGNNPYLSDLESNSRVLVKVNIIREKKYFPHLFFILSQFNFLLKILKINFNNNKTIYYFRYTSFLFLPIVIKLFGIKRIFLEINGIPNQSLLEGIKKPYFTYLRKLLLFQYDKLLFKSVDYLLTVCEVFEKNIIKNYGIKKAITVIPNGYFSEDVELSSRDKAKQELGLDNEKKYCIYAGHLVYYEGIEFLVDAFQKLCSMPSNNDKVLLILGEGPLHQKLQSQIAPEFRNNIIFLGYVSRDKMRKYIAASHVGVYTPLEVSYGQDNQRGGSPLKIVDYLSVGRPILVPKSSYYEYVERERIGNLFQSGDIKSFCTNLSKLINNEQEVEKLGKDARSYAELNLEWKHTLFKLFSLIEKEWSGGRC